MKPHISDCQERILLGVAEFDDHRAVLAVRAREREQHFIYHIAFFVLFALMFCL